MSLANGPNIDPSTVVQPLRSRRWLLLASLALNVLLVGLIVGAVWRGTREGGAGFGPRPGGPGQMFAYLASLPPERRATIIREGKLARGEVRELRRHVREAQRERIAALTADTFDRDRYAAAQTRLDNAEARLRELLATSLKNAAAAMTPDERRAFVTFRPIAGWQDREDEGGAKK